MKSLPISQVDTLFANGSYPIELLFYYPERIKTRKIRSALKTLSAAFWPVFGQYETGVISFDKYSESDCYEEAVSDREFRPDEPPSVIFETYRQAVPLAASRLFFLKIIQARNGTLLIPKMNHLAGDGYSYFHLLSALAALSRGRLLAIKKPFLRSAYAPYLDRTSLRPFRFHGRAATFPLEAEKLLIEFILVPRREIQEVIQGKTSNFRGQFSANDFLSAMVLKKMVRIRDGPLREAIELTIPMDVRRRIQEFGPKFFGNGLMFHRLKFRSSDIEAGGVPDLAMQIRQGMPAVTNDIYLDYLSGIEAIIAAGRTEELRPYDPQSGCLVTNLSKLPADQLDFGTGRPRFLFPLTIEKHSAAILADAENFILRLAT